MKCLICLFQVQLNMLHPETVFKQVITIVTEQASLVLDNCDISINPPGYIVLDNWVQISLLLFYTKCISLSLNYCLFYKMTNTLSKNKLTIISITIMLYPSNNHSKSLLLFLVTSRTLFLKRSRCLEFRTQEPLYLIL